MLLFAKRMYNISYMKCTHEHALTAQSVLYVFTIPLQHAHTCNAFTHFVSYTKCTLCCKCSFMCVFHVSALRHTHKVHFM